MNRRELTAIVRSGAIFYLGYLIVTQLSTFLYTIAGTAPALIGSPVGVAIAGLVMGGMRLWPAIPLASLTNSILNGVPLSIAIVLMVGQTAQSILGAYILRRLNFNPLLDQLRDVAILLGTGVVVTVILPTLVVIAMWVLSIPTSLSITNVWGAWWVGGIFSVFVISPLIMRWIKRPRKKRTWSQIAETGASILLVSISITLLTWTSYGDIFGISLLYVVLVALAWVALRAGPRGMTLAVFLMATLGLSGIAFSSDTPESASLAARLVNGEAFITVLAAIFLLLNGVSEERKRTLYELEKYVTDLEKVLGRVSSDAQVKTEFLAILAHELRNPLAPMLSSIELMKLGAPDKQERKRLLAGMEERVLTMSRLLDDLLDISRITRKKLKLRKEIVDITPIIDSAIITVEPILKANGHHLTLSMPNTQLLIEADPTRIEQVIINLLSNASKYTESGGQISLICKREDETCMIIVRDTGIGIPKEMLALIFEPFLQVPKDIRQNSGLGIGLSLTKKLVEMHRGTISAYSAGSNAGSEFTVRLPAPTNIQLPIETPRQATTQKESDAAAKTESPLRILIVDDNEAAAENMKQLLTLKGHDVSTAYDGAGAFLVTAETKPDVVLLDIGLPDMSGYDVIQTLREKNKDARSMYFIALTGYGQEEDKMKARKAGFNDHLTKPVGLADIEAALAKVNRV